MQGKDTRFAGVRVGGSNSRAIRTSATIHSVESTTTSQTAAAMVASNALFPPSAAATNSVQLADSLLLNNPSTLAATASLQPQQLKTTSSRDSAAIEQRQAYSRLSRPDNDNDSNNNHVLVIGGINQQRDYSSDVDGQQAPESGRGQSASINLETGQEFEPSTVGRSLDGGQESDSMLERQQSKQHTGSSSEPSEGVDGPNHHAATLGGGPLVETTDNDNYKPPASSHQQPSIERRFGLFKKSHQNMNNNNNSPYLSHGLSPYSNDECERCYIQAGLNPQSGNNWMLDTQYRQPISSQPFIGSPGMFPTHYMSPLKSKFQNKFQFAKPGGELFHGSGGYSNLGGGRYRMPLSGRSAYRVPIQTVNCLQPAMVRNGAGLFVGAGLSNQEPIIETTKSGSPYGSPSNQQF